MIEQTLRQIGLTQGEIRVYEALLELGASATGDIIKKSEVSGSKVYEVLDRLAKKGLVSSITRNGVKYFEASSPIKILDYLEEQKQNIDNEKMQIQKIIPELILKQQNKKRAEAKIFTGWEGLKTVQMDIINELSKGDEWLSMGLTDQPKAWEIWFTKTQKERAKKGIALKHLLNEKYYSLYEERKNLPHTEFRFLPKEFDMITSTEIYADKVLIFIMNPQDPLAIRIESKAIADGFKKYFYALWKQAKR